jgi:hypothetical protein
MTNEDLVRLAMSPAAGNCNLPDPAVFDNVRFSALCGATCRNRGARGSGMAIGGPRPSEPASLSLAAHHGGRQRHETAQSGALRLTGA